ncbi:hypothetical protein E4U58_003858 [Claviceps cyperi]|nr:hypothetical protein E4U58_003858 [Claviceps cyperi]
MEAHTNPEKQPGLRQPDFATAADLSRGFAEQRERCRKTAPSGLSYQFAWTAGAFDGKLDNLDCKVQNLDTKVQNLEAKLDTRLASLEAKVTNLETKVSLLVTKLDRVVNIITARSAEMDEKNVKSNKKIDAV